MRFNYTTKGWDASHPTLLCATVYFTMQYISVKTRILQPPKDDLYNLMDEYLFDVQEGDLILITSKVVSIHQGLCIPYDEVKEKRDLVEQEAEYFIEGHVKYSQSPLAIKYGALFFGAGIDESNSGDYYTLLPKKPYDTAQEIWEYLTEKHGVKNIGVIITDSHSLPLRRGCVGISIGLWGFHPIDHHVGKPDLFGRVMRLSSTSIADSVSAGAAAVSGESDECTPITIVRGVPNIRFTSADTRHEILMPPEDDIYYPLMKIFYQ